MNAHAPIKLGDRQEQFCLLIVEGKSANQAYLAAYDGVKKTSAEACASRLLANAKVKARIEQIRADNAANSRVSVPFLTGLLMDAYRLGMSTKQSSAASQAVLGIAKLHGLLIDKQQVDMVIRKPSASPESPDDMSEAQWLGEFVQTPMIEHEASPSEASPTIDADNPPDKSHLEDRN